MSGEDGIVRKRNKLWKMTIKLYGIEVRKLQVYRMCKTATDGGGMRFCVLKVMDEGRHLGQ